HPSSLGTERRTEGLHLDDSLSFDSITRVADEIDQYRLESHAVYPSQPGARRNAHVETHTRSGDAAKQSKHVVHDRAQVHEPWSIGGTAHRLQRAYDELRR